MTTNCFSPQGPVYIMFMSLLVVTLARC
jgi:hypothetical protein